MLMISFRFGLLILIALDKHVHHQFQYVQQVSLEKKYIDVEFINVWACGVVVFNSPIKRPR